MHADAVRKAGLFPAGDAAGGAGAGALRAIERAFDRVFGAQANPWRHLGALATRDVSLRARNETADLRLSAVNMS